jgi:hypothetical protein
MARSKQNRLKAVALLALGFMLLFTVGAYAEDPPFSGKWRGESRAAAPGGPGGTPGGAPGAGGAGAAAAAPAGAPGGAPAAGGPGTAPAAPGGGGGAPGGGAARGGGGRGGGFATQKVSLNLKQSKDNKLSGNITFGESESLDVKEGKVDGNIITFKAGRPQPLDYKGELKGDELILSRENAGGRGPATQYVLSKK